MSNDLSVVITNWNYGQYLGAAIQSITTQTVQPVHWYIVDDGSTDAESLDIYGGLEPEHLHLMGSQQGAVAAYQRGLDLCQTRWIIYLDADDMLADNYVEATMGVATLREVPWVYTDCVYVNEGGAETGKVKQCEFDATEIQKGNFIHSACLIEADLIREAGGWQEDKLEDWHLWRRVAKLGAVAVRCADTVLYYRKHGDSRMGSGRGL